MLTLEDKEKMAREADSDVLLETLIGLVVRGAHNYYSYRGADRDEVIENFSVTQNEILRRMEAASVVERDSTN